MKLFTDARTGKRLGIGFGITLCLMVVIVTTGILSLNGIGDRLDRMVVVNAAKIKYANYVGVHYSSQAQTALQDIIKSVDGLYGGVHRIAGAIEEMSATTDEITRDINQIWEVTKVNLSSSEEISGAAVELSQLATNLESAARKFRVM
jgi:methyl-accepting chemotaxis protein